MCSSERVEGEKTVTRYILEQTRRNGDDIAALNTRMGRVENRLGGVEQRLDGVEQRLGGVEQRLGGVELKLDRHIDAFARFREEFPSQVADVMREVLREPRD